jgi:putative endonuclease
VPVVRPPRSRSPRSQDSPAGRPDGRRVLGTRGEQLAAEHLERLGLRVLARNVRTRHGEIDLIASNGHSLVFAEVKTRQLRRRAPAPALAQDPLASLRARQRLRLRRLAVAWLAAQRSGGSGAAPFAHTIRFDAIGVLLDDEGALLRLDHLEGAW